MRKSQNHDKSLEISINKAGNESLIIYNRWHNYNISILVQIYGYYIN
jgi:hypothetical protein